MGEQTIRYSTETISAHAHLGSSTWERIEESTRGKKSFSGQELQEILGNLLLERIISPTDAYRFIYSLSYDHLHGKDSISAVDYEWHLQKKRRLSYFMRRGSRHK